jgi:hypothetical protein
MPRGRPPGNHHTPDERRRRGNLAWVLRGAFHENVIRDWFLMILSGRNPVIVEDKRFSEQGGFKVAEDPLDKMPPSQERRDAAMKELLLRIYGQPAAYTVLQAELDAKVRHELVAVDELVELPPHVLGSLTTLLRSALPPSDDRTPPPARVLDVAAVEATPHPQ